MKINHVLGIALILIVVILPGCDKDNEATNYAKIMGTWISLDNSDTLDFVDNANFYKSNITMRYDHFNYQLSNDSIEVGYNGIMFILVIPTKHKYYIEGDTLTIDFSNTGSYGFEQKIMTYTKYSEVGP